MQIDNSRMYSCEEPTIIELQSCEFEGYTIGLIENKYTTEPIYLEEFEKSLEADGIFEIFYPVDCQLDCCGTTIKSRVTKSKLIWEEAYFRDKISTDSLPINDSDNKKIGFYLPIEFSKNEIIDQLKDFKKKINF